MEEDLRAHLAADAALGLLVAQRIQWGEAEDGDCVALHLISDLPDWVLKGPSGLEWARVQIDCWAGTFLAAKSIGKAVQAAMPAIGQVVGETKFLSCVRLDRQRDSFGERPNLFHRTRMDYRVSYRPA